MSISPIGRSGNALAQAVLATPSPQAKADSTALSFVQDRFAGVPREDENLTYNERKALIRMDVDTRAQLSEGNPADLRDYVLLLETVLKDDKGRYIHHMENVARTTKLIQSEPDLGALGRHLEEQGYDVGKKESQPKQPSSPLDQIAKDQRKAVTAAYRTGEVPLDASVQQQLNAVRIAQLLSQG